MNKHPVMIGLLVVLALFSLTTLVYRLLGLSRGMALYLACLTTTLMLYWLTRRTLRGQ